MNKTFATILWVIMIIAIVVLFYLCSRDEQIYHQDKKLTEKYLKGELTKEEFLRRLK